MSQTKRVVAMVALLPITAALSIVTVAECTTHFPWQGFDELRWFQLLFSAQWVIAIAILWSTQIFSNVPRTILFIILGGVPFSQILFNQALVPTSSGGWIDFDEEFYRLGQHQISVALWLWLLSGTWSYQEKKSMQGNDTKSTLSDATSILAARFAASIGTIPMAFGVFLIVMVVVNNEFRLNSATELAITYMAVAPIVIATWVMIWRSAMVWSPNVTLQTGVATVLLIFVPIFSLWHFNSLVTRNSVLGMLLHASPVIGWGLWMATTVFLWRFVPSAMGVHSARPMCPECGYLLIGLTSTRCPECGTEPTLDELWGASGKADA